MKYKILTSFLTIGVSLLPVQAQQLNAESLREIKTFAAEFCGELFSEGEGTSLRIDGSTEAKLSGILKKLTDIGFEGSFNIDNSKYIGVLQEDLVGERENVRACKLLLWNDLKTTVLNANTSNTVNLYNYRFPFTSSTWLNSSDLNQYSSRDLRIMRNEIYAKYGYKFKSADLRKYFISQPWYNPQTSSAEAAYAKMSATERSNVLAIRAAERAR